MEPSRAFEIWARQSALWSRWVKPLLFAESLGTTEPDEPWAPEPPPPIGIVNDGRTGVVVELPGAESVRAGLGLAYRGFCPVPLFNGNPGPSPVIDVLPIREALLRGAEHLERLSLREDAPPAFLIDADRLQGAASAGRFDNRWMVFPQDFPSAAFLKAQGIGRIVLLGRPTSSSLSSDLAHVLLRFKEGGLTLFRCEKDSFRESPLEISTPSNFRVLWYRALALAGLRRHAAGGFGSVVPLPPSAGGGFRSFG